MRNEGIICGVVGEQECAWSLIHRIAESGHVVSGCNFLFWAGTWGLRHCRKGDGNQERSGENEGQYSC
jgi:hypothetical protein